MSRVRKPLALKESRDSKIILSSRPKISPCKYLRRTLQLNLDDGGTSLAKLRIKRIHIRKIVEIDRIDEIDWDFDIQKQSKLLNKLEKTSRKCLKKKLFKTLTSLKLRSFYGKYWLEELKTAKRLTQFNCDPYSSCEPKMILSYLKRINKNLEELNFSIGYYWSIKGYYWSIKGYYFLKLSRAIGSFSHLKVYQGEEKTKIDWKLSAEEFKYLYQCLRRSSRLTYFDCYLSNRTEETTWELLKEETVFPKVTKVRAYLLNFDDESNKNFARELPHIFPNLKELEFSNDESYDKCHPLTAQGFKNLQSLEKLSLKLSYYDDGISSVIKGLLDLPKLSSLSLEIENLKEKHWDALISFLENQTNLVSLKVEIKWRYSQFETLEDFLASLSGMHKLQYLCLKAPQWPISSLSNGLKQVVGIHKLKSFEFHSKSSWYRSLDENSFKGFCKFLLRNKDTLHELILDFPLMPEKEVNQKISTTISQLNQLKNLWLTFYVSGFGELTEKERKTSWDPDLDSNLLKLEKLEDFTLDFESLGNVPLIQRKWMSRLFSILPSLKALKSFEFMIPSTFSQSQIDMIELAIKDLNHLHNLDIWNSQDSPDAKSCKILEAVENFRRKQTLFGGGLSF